jgi:hypothetical protein
VSTDSAGWPPGVIVGGLNVHVDPGGSDAHDSAIGDGYGPPTGVSVTWNVADSPGAIDVVSGVDDMSKLVTVTLIVDAVENATPLFDAATSIVVLPAGQIIAGAGDAPQPPVHRRNRTSH